MAGSLMECQVMEQFRLGCSLMECEVVERPILERTVLE